LSIEIGPEQAEELNRQLLDGWRLTLEAESKDYVSQKAEAQNQITMYQQALNGANQRYLLADGAHQAVLALLAKLEKKDEKPTPPAP
jgi:hypothetical protein